MNKMKLSSKAADEAVKLGTFNPIEISNEENDNDDDEETSSEPKLTLSPNGTTGSKDIMSAVQEQLQQLKEQTSEMMDDDTTQNTINTTEEDIDDEIDPNAESLLTIEQGNTLLLSTFLTPRNHGLIRLRLIRPLQLNYFMLNVWHH